MVVAKELWIGSYEKTLKAGGSGICAVFGEEEEEEEE